MGGGYLPALNADVARIALDHIASSPKPHRTSPDLHHLDVSGLDRCKDLQRHTLAGRRTNATGRSNIEAPPHVDLREIVNTCG